MKPWLTHAHSSVSQGSMTVKCTASLGTDVGRQPAKVCGTAFQLVLNKRTAAMNSSSGC